MSLEGKTALVTGGAVRIGKAISLALAERGVRIALHYGSSADAAAATVAQIRSSGVDAEAFRADLRDTSTLEGLVEEGRRRFGRIDILVNSAAVFIPGGLEETTEALWEEHFSINLKAPFFLCRAFARQAGTAGGDIVNITDWRTVRPGAYYLAYTLAKGGMAMLTASLAKALAPSIRVNAIAPGAILPPPGRDEAYLEKVAGNTPLKRHGSPGDVCGALLYLLEAPYVTGQTIYVDGGEHL